MVQVTMQQTDVAGKPTKKMDISFAQRILNVKHPQKGWKLADAAYKIVGGIITAIPQAAQAPAPMIVTQDMIDKNPALVIEGLKVGDPFPVKAK